jgi:hypothetical protein
MLGRGVQSQEASAQHSSQIETLIGNGCYFKVGSLPLSLLFVSVTPNPTCTFRRRPAAAQSLE